MSPQAISFDCAQTLIETNWVPEEMALIIARRIGWELDEPVAASTYRRIIGTRWPEFMQVNLERSEAACQAFWQSVTEEWVDRMGADRALVTPMMEVADEVLYGPETEIFRVYDDVVPSLESLQLAGFRLIVVSNWDNSLHRVLREFGLTRFFEFAIASLEEGVEKPAPGIFEVALNRLGLAAADVLHIGDNPIDDVQGARGVGMPALLLDRTPGAVPGSHVLTSLADLPARLGL